MWARTQLKIGFADLLAGAVGCILPRDRAAFGRGVEAYWSDAGDTLAAYSVRSGFDLLLQALDLRQGDEVVFSALNVKGMINIVRRMGLVAVPVDLDVAHMAPAVGLLRQAIGPRAKVLVVAHLFGSRVDLDPLVAVAKEHGLIVVEDCAQAFDGHAYRGHPAADVSMFSFGPLKTATALGGALLRVRDPALRSRMRALQATYPVQPNAKQLKRVLQFAALKIVTSRPVLGAIYRFFHARGQDYEDALSESVRNVAPLKSSKQLRQQPSVGLLALMARRLARFPDGSLADRQTKGERLRQLLGDAVVLPAQANAHHDYWVFPILVDDPKAYIERLRAGGFDGANLPRSQAVEAPEYAPHLEPKLAARALSDLIVVPCYDGMPDSEIVRLAEVIREITRDVGSERTRAYAAASPDWTANDRRAEPRAAAGVGYGD
jgi:perosamine synthetase